MLIDYFQDQLIEENIYTQKDIDDSIGAAARVNLVFDENTKQFLSSKIGQYRCCFIAIERNPMNPALLKDRFFIRPFSGEIELFEDTLEYLEQENGFPLFHIIDKEGFHIARDTMYNSIAVGMA